MSTSLPAQRPRQTFPQISGVSLGAPRRPRRAAGPAVGPWRGRGHPEDARTAGRRAGHAAPVPGQRRPGGTGAVSQALAPAQRGGHDFRLAHRARAVRLADAILQCRRLRHRPAVHRGPLGCARAARRRRTAGAAGPRAGPRDQRARALPHHRRHPRPHQPRRAPDARRAWPCFRSASPFSSGRGNRSCRPTVPGCWARRTSWRRSGST